MSLFVGNISKHVKLTELEEEFNRFGRCEIKRQVSNVSKTLLIQPLSSLRNRKSHLLVFVNRALMLLSSTIRRKLLKRPWLS